MDEEARPASWWRENYIRILVLLVTIGIMAASILLGVAYKDKIKEIKEFENFSYSFIFLMGIAGSAAPIWPLTGAISAFLWAGWSGLSWGIPFVALAAGTGEAIGELSGYTLGYGGQPAFKKWKRYQRFEEWMKRHRAVAIFLVSAVPIPLHIIKLVNASAGASHFPVWKMFLLCWMGKIIKCFGFALAGVGLLSWITDLV
jgi:uncharacterized membrane protein YdjX (TVP38/TMEM64 family)